MTVLSFSLVFTKSCGKIYFETRNLVFFIHEILTHTADSYVQDMTLNLKIAMFLTKTLISYLNCIEKSSSTVSSSQLSSHTFTSVGSSSLASHSIRRIFIVHILIT